MRKVVFKSSAHYYGAEQDDPAFFTEAHGPPARAAHADRARHRRGRARRARVRRCATRTSRSPCCASPTGSGPALRTSLSRLFGLPACPAILGFDPRFQFIHEDDLAGCLEHAVRHDLEGVYNVAADGVLVAQRGRGLLGKPLAPVLPPWGRLAGRGALRRAGLRIPPEMLGQLRFGRGLDNRSSRRPASATATPRARP